MQLRLYQDYNKDKTQWRSKVKAHCYKQRNTYLVFIVNTPGDN